MEGSSGKKIGHEIGGVERDALRFGLHGVKSDILEVHPLQSLHQSVVKSNEEMKSLIATKTYGTAFSLKDNLDRQILSSGDQEGLRGEFLLMWDKQVIVSAGSQSSEISDSIMSYEDGKDTATNRDISEPRGCTKYHT